MSRERVGSGLGAVGSVVLAALVPKCPLCVAAALSAVGLGATVSAALAPFARPLLFLVAALALTLSVRAAWRARRPRASCTLCSRE